MSLGKKLEIGFKNLSAVILRSLLSQPPKMANPPFRRVLYIRYGGIGDMLLSLPLFRATRDQSPDTIIDVLCDRKNVSPIQGTSLVDNLYYYDKAPRQIVSLVRQLRRHNYDYVCNLLVYPTFTFGLLARLIGPRALRAGGDQGRFSYLYNRLIDLPPKRDIPMLDRLFLLAEDAVNKSAASLETPWADFEEDVKTQAEALYHEMVKQFNGGNTPARIAAVNLTAGLQRREWPLEKFREFLAAAIEKYDSEIDGWLVFTDPGKPEAAEWLANAVSHPKLKTVPANKDYRIIIQFLRHIFLLITPDTSFTHAASAMGTPVLNLMIGENVVTWPPVGVPHVIVASQDPVNLTELPVADVADGFDALMTSIEHIPLQKAK